MKRLVKMSATTFCCLTLLSLPSNAQDMPRAVECRNMKGSFIQAPEWKSQEDGMSFQDLILDYRTGNSKSSVGWFRNDKLYSKEEGVGVAMTSGFAIVIAASDRIET